MALLYIQHTHYFHPPIPVEFAYVNVKISVEVFDPSFP